MNNYSNNIDKNANDLVNQAAVFFTDLWKKITDFFSSYKWQEIVFIIKFILIIISIILVILIIVLLIRIIVFSPVKRSSARKSGVVFDKKKINKKWEKIDKRIESNIETNYKLALLDADKLFDRVIKELGYGTEKRLSNIDDIKRANKLKDTIIEDKKYNLSKEEVQPAADAYKKGLEELGVL